MKKLATTLGIWGATLGMLAGLIELGIGSQIRPWIGNKENPAVLGLVTMLLSGMALAAATMARRQEAHTNDGKLAIFLGVLLPRPSASRRSGGFGTCQAPCWLVRPRSLPTNFGSPPRQMLLRGRLLTNDGG